MGEDAAVTAFLEALDHPLKAEIVAVRADILALDPAIGEGIKWKAPTFRARDDFATVNLRSTETLQLILHLGAKVRSDPPKLAIDDPAGLLKWLAKDRAMATLGAGAAFEASRPPFAALLRQWLTYV